jgi:hypothetical protein
MQERRLLLSVTVLHYACRFDGCMCDDGVAGKDDGVMMMVVMA